MLKSLYIHINQLENQTWQTIVMIGDRETKKDEILFRSYPKPTEQDAILTAADFIQACSRSLCEWK